MLATGDSMMLLTDRELERALERGGRARVTADIRVATGLSKPHLLDWRETAKRQVRRHRPDAVVVAMGANDRFPLDGAACCGPGWIAEYAQRVRRAALVWRRRGAARVYWLLLPAPEAPQLVPAFEAVNAALRSAAAVVAGLRVVDVGSELTPGGVFRARMVVDGELRRVRSTDGVHLWFPGARVAARMVVRRLAADGLLRRQARGGAARAAILGA